MRNFDTPMNAAGGAAGGGVAPAAGAGTKCNLKRGPVPGVLVGTAGNQTEVQIKNADGAATFMTISYNGTEIAKDTDSATFTIAAGDIDLSFVYEGSAAGDQITIEDPCGAELFAFLCDPGNFRIILTVRA
jgi:hypothetical protein